MNQNSKLLVIGCSLLLISRITFSQKMIHAYIKFPVSVNSNKIKIFYDNGKEWKIIRAPFVNNEVIISDSLYSKYASISCTYYSNLEKSSYSVSFFVWGTLADIRIKENKDSLANPFLYYTLKNAYDISETAGFKKMTKFISRQSRDYEDFLKKHDNEIAGNDSLKEIGRQKRKRLLNKELDFIMQNGSDYYSFWIFKNELVSVDDFLSADTLLKIYAVTFPKALKNSFEGRQIESMLRGKINISAGILAPYFKSIDIQNKPVDLKDFHGKYVLLNFWASWCGPCIAELGIIRELNMQYGNTKLVVISISTDRDKNAFLKALKRNKMNWINIYHDIEIENIFLKGGEIPQVYLIDPNGKLIYSRQSDKDYDLYKLRKILESNK